MKHKQYSAEQIVAALKQAELGMPVADLVRQLGISEGTYYRWKKQYAGLESNQVRELKQLQDENERLKKLVAELSLDKAILQDIATKRSSNTMNFEAVASILNRTGAVSRRACHGGRSSNKNGPNPSGGA